MSKTLREVLDAIDPVCDNCNHGKSEHDDLYGCQHEFGDHYAACKDGGTVLAARGPCGCRDFQTTDEEVAGE